MAQTLLLVGLACLIAAIVGGGLTAFQVQLPALKSTVRQVMLAIVGLGLIGSSVYMQFYYRAAPSGASPQTPAAQGPSTNAAPTSSPPPASATVATAAKPQASASSAKAPVAPAPPTEVPPVRTAARPFEGAPESAKTAARESGQGVPRPNDTQSDRPPAAPAPPRRAPDYPEISLAGVQCRAIGKGFLVQASGSARAAPGEPALFYLEIDKAAGGGRFRPACASWRAAAAADDPDWYRVSCFHDPASPVSTDWRLAVEDGGERPAVLFMGLVRPNAGKSFIAHLSRPLDCR
jgi:hypothetical protein